jgi:hypothetical protein
MNPQSVAITVLFSAFSELAKKKTCSPGELMKIVSFFLCANLASDGEKQYSIATFHRQDGLSIKYPCLKETYPGSTLKLGKEKNGKFSLAAGYFTIFFSYEGHEYELSYNSFESVKYFEIFGDDNGDALFCAEFVFPNGKPMFQIRENKLDSYFASLSHSKNVSHSCAGPALAGPSSDEDSSEWIKVVKGNGKGKASFYDVFLSIPAHEQGQSWADIDAPAPETHVKVAPAPETHVKVAPAPETPVKDAPAPETPVKDAPAPETHVKDAPAPETSVKDAPAPETSIKDAPAPETSVKDALASKTERLGLIKRLLIPGSLRMSLMKSSISEDEIKLALELLEENEMKDYFSDLLSQSGSSSA